MNKIKEIWSSMNDNDVNGEINILKKILEVQAEAINKQKAQNEIYATLVTVKGENDSELINVMYLLPVFGNGYNYRYIEFIQPIDSIYPVKVRAFQNGNTDFGVITEEQGEKGIYEVLGRIFNDLRTKIVFNQLKAMGRTIKGWKEDAE